MAFSFIVFWKAPLVKELITAAVKKGYDKLLNRYECYRILADLGLAKPVDQFERIYIHTVFLFSSRNVHPEFIQLLLLPESVKAFKEEYHLGINLGFVDSLDDSLKTNELVDQISHWEDIPMYEIDIFARIYKDLVNSIATPVQREILNNQTDQTDIMLEIRKEMREGFQVLKTEFKMSPAVAERTDDPLQQEYQSQVDDLTSDLEKGLSQRAIDGFLRLKAKSWMKINDALRFRMLTNLGVAYYQLLDNENAAKFLIQAYDYQPDSLTSLSNLVNAYMAMEDEEQSSRYMVLLLNKFPMSVAAHTTRIKLEAENESFEKLIKSVPVRLRKDPDVLSALGMAARKQKNLPLSIKYLTKAHRLRPNDDYFQQHLLQSHLESYSRNFMLLNMKILHRKTEKELQMILGLIDTQLLRVENTDQLKVRVTLLHAQGFVRSIMQQIPEALASLEKALLLDPDNQQLIKQKGYTYAMAGLLSEAIEALSRITDYRTMPDVPCLLAECYRNNDETSTGIEILSKYLPVSGDEGAEQVYFKNQAAHILLDMLILDNKDDQLKAMEKEYFLGDSTADRLSHSKIHRYFGRIDEAKKMIFEAYESIDEGTAFRKKVFVADQLVSYGFYNEAIAIFEKLADRSHASSLAFKLYKLYHKVGRVNKSLEVLRALREKNGPLTVHTPFEVEILQELSDYNQVAKVAESYCKKFPEDDQMRIILTSTYLRLGARPKAKKLLAKPLIYWKFADVFFQNYLAQLTSVGERELAYHYAYEFRRLRDNREAHMTYLGMLEQYPLPQKMQNPDKVVFDTVVALRDDQWSSYKLVVEERATAELLPNELNVDDPRFKVLRGKKLGDKVKLDRSGSRWEIVGLTSKFEEARLESELMRKTVFADKPLPEEEEAVDQTGLEDDQEFRYMVFSNQVLSAYLNRKIPLGNAANAFKKGIIDTWAQFVNEPKIGISSCGFAEDNLAEHVLILKGKKITADITVLLVLHQLGLFEPVFQAFGKLTITPSTFDLVFDAYEGSRSYRLEGSSDAVLGDLKLLTEKYCEEVFPSSILEMDFRQKTSLDKAMGKSFADTMALCNERGDVLWTEDAHIRRAVREEYQTDGVWTQAVLLYLYHEKFISRVAYDDAVIKLILMNYRRTAIDPLILLRAFEIHFQKELRIYQKVVYLLHGGISDFDSGLRAMFAFLVLAWQVEGISDEVKGKMTEFTVLSFCFKRDANEVIQAVYATLSAEQEKVHSDKVTRALRSLKVQFAGLEQILKRTG